MISPRAEGSAEGVQTRGGFEGFEADRSKAASPSPRARSGDVVTNPKFDRSPQGLTSRHSKHGLAFGIGNQVGHAGQGVPAWAPASTIDSATVSASANRADREHGRSAPRPRIATFRSGTSTRQFLQGPDRIGRSQEPDNEILGAFVSLGDARLATSDR